MRPSVTSPNPYRSLFSFGPCFRSNYYPWFSFWLKTPRVLHCCHFVPTSNARGGEEGLSFLWIRNEPWICKDCSHWEWPTGSRGIKQQEVKVSPPKGSPRTLEVGTVQCLRSRRGTRRLNRTSACISSEPFPAGEKTQICVRTEIYN